MAAPSLSPAHIPAPVSIVETYSLINDHENGHHPRLSAFVVRLTDASLKALNQAIADARIKKTKDHQTLGFVELNTRHANASEGSLCFGGNSSVVHRFSVTDAQRDLGPKGQLEAVEQQRIPAGQKFNKNASINGSMKYVDLVNHRLQISATTEDTFESTKQKAQQASEEMLRKSAKVALKPPVSNGNQTAASKLWNKMRKSAASTSQRPLTPLSHQHPKHPTPSKTINGTNPSTNGAANVNDVSKRPLRQRIMYKLFVNPTTASELLNKLTGEGLSDHDRTVFDRILNEVAQHVRRSPDASSTVCSTGGESPVYEVKRSLFTEIRSDDWPYYNNWERQTCRKKLLTHKNPPPPPPPPSSQHHHQSNANSTTQRDNSEDTTKRVNSKMAYRPQAKKPPTNSPPSMTTNGTTSNGIIHGKSPPESSVSLQSPPRLSSSTAATTSPTPAVAMKSDFEPPPKKFHKEHVNDGETNSLTPASSREPSAPVNGSNGHDMDYDQNLRRKHRKEHQRPALTNTNNHSNGMVNGSSKPQPTETYKDVREMSPPAPSLEDFRKEYPNINSASERRRYKDDFDRDYPTYLKLYERLRITASEFEKLGMKLKSAAKKTSEYEDIEKEILNKYRQFDKDTEMRRSRKEHERLRRKLGVIKERVKEYDDRQLAIPVLNGINDW